MVTRKRCNYASQLFDMGLRKDVNYVCLLIECEMRYCLPLFNQEKYVIPMYIDNGYGSARVVGTAI